MLLYSFTFIVFFILVFILFWKIPQNYKWILLLAASYYFYASWKPAYLALILLTTVVSYYTAWLMEDRPSYKGRLLLAGLLVNLSILFVFKYFNFFSFTIGQVTPLHLPQFELLLPIGISFYTLQVVGYLVDVYKGKTKAEQHLGIFALFVCFFPQLSAGPIERSMTLLPQLKKLPAFEYGQVAEGAKLFTFGLFKKLVIADNLALVVDRAFGSLPDYKGISLIIVIFLYTWQIYMDFSGYTDMARGIAKMVGINLLENFNTPYLASSIQDFWRRWHISFSSWLRDYVYFPLGGSRKGLMMTIINTIIVFLVSGLWHGAAWTFVIWGFLHGIGISAERVIKTIFGNRISIPTFFQVMYTYIVISILWVFFRAPTLQDALYVLRNCIVGIKNFMSPTYLLASLDQLFVFDRAEMVITFGLVIIAILLEIIQNKISFFHFVHKQPALVRLVVYVLLVFMILQLRNAEIKEFIYIRF